MASPDRYVIWGSAGHAMVLSDLLGLRGARVLALFDNNPQAVSCLPDVPLFHGDVGFTQWQKQQSSLKTVGAAVAIGGARGRERHVLVHRLRAAGLILPSLIHPSASIAASAYVGTASQILANTVLAAGARLGEACILNNSTNVDHECWLGDGVHIAPGAVLCGCVTIGDYAMIGAGAVILPRLKIGTGAIVGAGAVVTQDVSPGATVVGNPARPI